jgi:hypothetical protein
MLFKNEREKLKYEKKKYFGEILKKCIPKITMK